MGRKLNNSAKKNYKNHISSYVSGRPKWLPSTEIWGPWDKYPGRRSCRRNQVTWYKSEQSDWFGINYHISILVYRDLTDSPLTRATLLQLPAVPVTTKLQISLGKTNAIDPLHNTFWTLHVHRPKGSQWIMGR